MGEDYRIGEWDFDVAEGVLRSPSGSHRLEHRAARVLAMLCRHRGRPVTQAELLAEVWDGRAVADNSIAIVIGDLRRALGEDARSARYIVTLPKRGYRLASPEPPTRMIGRPKAAPVWRRRAGVVVVGLGLLAALAVLGWRERSAPITLAVERVRNETGSTAFAPMSRALDGVIVDQLSGAGGLAVIDASGQRSPGLRLVPRLTLWDGTPALSLRAVDERDGRVVWATIAEAPASRIARVTAGKLDDLKRRLKAGPPRTWK
ncbi:winged helix-turn-helix domain-containing protein [Caulobacter sp. LARHSG274]